MRKNLVLLVCSVVFALLISVPALAVEVTHTPPGLTQYYRAKVFVIERILGKGSYGNRYIRIQTADEGKVFGIEVDDPGMFQPGDRVRITDDNRLVSAKKAKASKKMGMSVDSYAGVPVAPAPLPAASAAAGCCLGGAYLLDFRGETFDMIITHNGCGRSFYVDTTSNATQFKSRWSGTAVPRANSNCCQVSFSRKGSVDSNSATGVFCPRGNGMYGSGSYVRSFASGETPYSGKWTAKAQ